MSIHDTASDTDDAQAENQLRFEVSVRWDRPLTDDRDDPEWLKKRLGTPGIENDVSVVEFTERGARLLVVADAGSLQPKPGTVASKVRRVVGMYNRNTINADTVNDIPTGAMPHGVHKKHVKRAAEGGERPTGRGRDRATPEDWEQIKAIADKLDFEGAPNLTPEIHVRTLEGAPAPFEVGP